MGDDNENHERFLNLHKKHTNAKEQKKITQITRQKKRLK